ncbi:MAG TPA: hypothetical protein VNZ49_05385 [Bacteroidia bacterium]|nr:hypothetical protein [Bacteroidia bacterium]
MNLIAKFKCFFLVLIAIYFFSSCTVSKMQVVSLDCNKLRKDTTWVYSDSIVKIVYFYYTNGGKITFILANISDKPIFFDGKNSFILAGNKKLEYWQDVEQINGYVTFRNSTHFYSVNDPIHATVSKQERIVLIPPNSNILVSKYFVHDATMFDMSKYTISRDTVPVNWDSGSKKKTVISKASFKELNSPEAFRNFLTISRTEDFKNPLYYDFSFWVAEIWEMDARQGTKSDYPPDFATGGYVEGNFPNSGRHPYKKPWKFYLNNIPKQ